MKKSTSISSFRSHIFLEREVTTHSSRPPSINIAPVRWVFTYHRISATRGTWQHTVRMSLSVLCYMRCAVVFEAPAQFLPLLFFQVSSSSSTLSLLFGKRSFSSGLVISGLSAAEGGNTTDTQSSSSVNIAMGPSHRSSSRATQVRHKSTSIYGDRKIWFWSNMCRTARISPYLCFSVDIRPLRE